MKSPPSPHLSVTIITLNEEHNIAQAIQSVQWADEVIVVDSGSSDRTAEIAQKMGARVFHQPWLGYGQQKNFAHKQAMHDWVLNIDADERVTPELEREIRHSVRQVDSEKLDICGFDVPRKTFYMGKWIRHGGWYPNRLVRLVKRGAAAWSEPQVHEQLLVKGRTDSLKEPLYHEAFHSIEDQVLTNLKFAKLGSAELRANLEAKGRTASIFLMIFKPLGKFAETYFLKRGFLDGLAGFIISVNAAYSMFLKYAFLFEDRIRVRGKEKI